MNSVTTHPKPRVLGIGIDPIVGDFSTLPGLTPEFVRADIDAHSKSRVTRPMVREGRLRNGPGASRGRGNEPFHEARTQLHRFLAAAGGYTDQVMNYSFGAALAFLPHILGSAQAVTGR